MTNEMATHDHIDVHMKVVRLADVPAEEQPTEGEFARWAAHSDDIMTRTIGYTVTQVFGSDNHHGLSDGLRQKYVDACSKLRQVFNGDWAGPMIHWCRGCHPDGPEGREQVVAEASASVAEANVWPVDVATGPSIARFGSTGYVQARQMLPKCCTKWKHPCCQVLCLANGKCRRWKGKQLNGHGR